MWSIVMYFPETSNWVTLAVIYCRMLRWSQRRHDGSRRQNGVTEIKKCRPYGVPDTSWLYSGGCDGIVVNKNKVLFENGASGAGRLADMPHWPRTPCASRFPVSFAGINVAVLSTQRGTIYPVAAPKHRSVTATDD